MKEVQQDHEVVSALPSGSGTSISPAVCRICRSGESSVPYNGVASGEPLISPCLCKGTMGLYHRSCLELWLTTSNTSCCEICNFTFQIEKRYRTFCEFITHNEVERRSLLADIVGFFVFTPIAFGCITFCIISLVTPYSKGTGETTVSIEGLIGMFMLVTLLGLTYIAWLVIVSFFHMKKFAIWRNANVERYVIDQLTEQESLLINGTNRKSTPMWQRLKFSSCMGYTDASISSSIRNIVPPNQPEIANLSPIENNVLPSNDEVMDVSLSPFSSVDPNREQAVVVETSESTGQFMASTPLCVSSPCQAHSFNFSAIHPTISENNNECESVL